MDELSKWVDRTAMPYMVVCARCGIFSAHGGCTGEEAATRWRDDGWTFGGYACCCPGCSAPQAKTRVSNAIGSHGQIRQ